MIRDLHQYLCPIRQEVSRPVLGSDEDSDSTAPPTLCVEMRLPRRSVLRRFRPFSSP
jgi:hypothetical protein